MVYSNDFAADRDPIYIPVSRDFVASAIGTLTIKERLEPKHVPLPFEPQRIPLPFALMGSSFQEIRDVSADRLEHIPGTPPELMISAFTEKDKLQYNAASSARKSTNAALSARTTTNARKERRRLAFAQKADGALNDTPEHMHELVRQETKDLGLKVAKLVLNMPSKGKWWTSSRAPLTCPLTGFPIKLLPYPPFKLRSQMDGVLVDGKSLALYLISTGLGGVAGRAMQSSEVTSLSEYMHRCKLGPFRPDYAITLEKNAGSAELSVEERHNASQELASLMSSAKSELKKLQWIQEQRLVKLLQESIAGDAAHC